MESIVISVGTVVLAAVIAGVGIVVEHRARTTSKNSTDAPTRPPAAQH